MSIHTHPISFWHHDTSMPSIKRGPNDRRSVSTSGRKVMERRRRGKRRGYAASDALSADGFVVKAGAAILLVCVILGLSLQLVLHGGREPGLQQNPSVRQDADQSREARHSLRGDEKTRRDHAGWVPLQVQGSSAGGLAVNVLNPDHGVLNAPGYHGIGDRDDHKGGGHGSEFHGAFGAPIGREPPLVIPDYGGLSFPGEIQTKGPIELFLDQGGKLPVVLLTCNRLELLRDTVQSLRKVHGMDMSNVMVLQDGEDEQVKRFVKGEGLYLEQNNRKASNLRAGNKDGSVWIARHYKYALDHAFDTRREAPAVIIVEDDLLLSPDFLEFFEYNAPILERDPSTLILSAWNDNGYKGKVSDKTELKRTGFFPGLGWLLPRKLYEEELKAKWPDKHWDHWLRDPEQHRSRECIFPEISRTYHAGIQGTFMNKDTHNRLFKNVDYNTDATFTWKYSWELNGIPTYARAMKDNYERRVEARIQAARHVNSVEAIVEESLQESPREDVVFWYSLPVTEERGKTIPFKTVADAFGLWHQYARTEHNHMHSLRYRNGLQVLNVMIINEAKSTYTKFKPPDLKPAQGGSVLTPLHYDPIETGLRVVAARQLSQSCTSVCEGQNLECSEDSFGQLNTCDVLKKHFDCDGCVSSIGDEQPCFVKREAPSINYPGKCLLASQPHLSLCSASHELTYRLCPCVARH